MALLTPAMVEHLSAGVAHQVAACAADGRPCLSRALAADLEPDGRVLVLLSAESGFEVLDAVRATRRIALNLTSPATYRSLHLKGVDAEVGATPAHARALLERRHAAFRANLIPLGFRLEYTDAWYSLPDHEIAVIRFTPTEAFDQTPGPGAGNALTLQAAPR